MKIIFMRHGATAATEQGLFCGITNTPLSVAGEAQVRESKKYIENEKIDLWVSGNSLRTKQSAELLFDELVLPKDLIIYRDDIREINFGKFENLTFKEISVLFPIETNEYLEHWQSFAFPDGDSVADYFNECRKSINDIINKYTGKNLCIIAHKGYICACMCAIGELGIDHMFDLEIECGRFVAVEL